jgi:transposase-like protein
MPKPIVLPLPKTEVTPDPAVEKRARRTFSAEYKLRIIAEAAQCRRGELGALLRCENLYSNQLQEWRRQLAAGGEQALSKSAPGPRPKFTPEQREIEKLRRENARLARKLEIANGCLELQKNLPRGARAPRTCRGRSGRWAILNG